MSNRAMIGLVCTCCQQPFQIELRRYKTYQKAGRTPSYCSLQCAGKHKRQNKSIDQKRAEKAEYDRNYRATSSTLKARKAAYFQKTYDPVKQAIYNRTRRSLHLEYLRQPKQRAKKQAYDRQYRAKSKYGEYWESALLIDQIQAEYDDKEVRQENNLHNKSQNRKREWHKLQNSQQVL